MQERRGINVDAGDLLLELQMACCTEANNVHQFTLYI